MIVNKPPANRKFLWLGRGLAFGAGGFGLVGSAGSVYVARLMSSSSSAVVCSSVGLVRRVKVWSAWPMRRVLRVIVARSARRSVRVCAGWPSGVRALLALAWAARERVAG